MFQLQEAIKVSAETASQALTLTAIFKNAGVAALVAFAVMYATAYKKVGDDFVFLDWLYANRNRWINGIVTLLLFFSISMLVPDISGLSNAIGFNLNASVPLSFGLALAAWLTLSTKAKSPTPEEKPADPGKE